MSLAFRVRQIPEGWDEGTLAQLLADSLQQGITGIRINSLARSLPAADLPQTKEATVVFDKVPTTLKIPAKNTGFQHDVILDKKFDGLTVLNDAQRGDCPIE
jgi:hypothetical protein